MEEIKIEQTYEFRVVYRHRITDKIDYRIIKVGQSLPDIGPNWSVIGIDLYTGLIDATRKVFSGDIYRFLKAEFPITVSYENGFRFMHGKYLLSRDVVEHGSFLGTIYEHSQENERVKAC
jgi:hypothetical protein